VEKTLNEFNENAKKQLNELKEDTNTWMNLRKIQINRKMK
jgi:hypothetical protein